jgi:hypothetical protein
MGYDASGSIRKFDEDGDLSSGGAKLSEVFFVNCARMLQKDEIKKGSFSLIMGVENNIDDPAFDGANFTARVAIADLSGSTSYLVNSPAGDYGILYATSSGDNQPVLLANEQVPVGLLFYQAGIAVVSGSLFRPSDEGGLLHTSENAVPFGIPIDKSNGKTGFYFVTGSSISGSCDALRNRIYNLSFNNTTELNSTVYFCRASHNEFNYSSNPTYLNNSKIRVKSESLDQPVSYITTVGLYSANNELLAVAKVSEPLQKTPDTELVLRVRLDY